MSWPWNFVKSHSRSLKLVPFNRLVMDSYWCSIETLSVRHIRHTTFEIITFENAVTLKSGSKVTQGHRVMGYWLSLKMTLYDTFTYDLLLVFHNNYGPMSWHFRAIQCQKISWPWNSGQGSLKVIESGTIRYIGYCFLLLFYSSFVPKTHRIWV